MQFYAKPISRILSFTLKDSNHLTRGHELRTCHIWRWRFSTARAASRIASDNVGCE